MLLVGTPTISLGPDAPSGTQRVRRAASRVVPLASPGLARSTAQKYSNGRAQTCGIKTLCGSAPAATML